MGASQLLHDSLDIRKLSGRWAPRIKIGILFLKCHFYACRHQLFGQTLVKNGHAGVKRPGSYSKLVTVYTYRHWVKGPKDEHKLVSHKLFRHPPGSRTSGQYFEVPWRKSLFPWVLREGNHFLNPTPSRSRPPSHQTVSGSKK